MMMFGNTNSTRFANVNFAEPSIQYLLSTQSILQYRPSLSNRVPFYPSRMFLFISQCFIVDILQGVGIMLATPMSMAFFGAAIVLGIAVLRERVVGQLFSSLDNNLDDINMKRTGLK